MFKNYVKVAMRSLFKKKGHTAISIVSLSLGIGCFLFLLLLDQYAYQVDGFHEKGERIYRVNDRIVTQSGSEVNAAITPWPWAEALAAEFPEVESYVRFETIGHTIKRDDDAFSQGITYVDPTFFNVFSYKLARGDEETALAEPYQVVLSKSASERFFGNENAIGKTLFVDGTGFTVTGILDKFTDRSSIWFDLLASSENLTKQNFETIDNWKTHNVYTYLLLKEGTDKSKVEAGFNGFLNKYIDEDAASRYSPWLQPYESMYLGESLVGNHGGTLQPMYIYIFTAIALLILVISCINFINLATARAVKRGREVGMRKVLGAGRFQLMGQYLLEVFVITVFAVVFAVLFTEAALPWFNSITDWSVDIKYTENLFFWGSIFGVIALVTMLAGGYPAFYLSNFKPVQIFRNSGGQGKKSALRSVLVVSQFSLAVFLILSTLVIDNQLDYLKNKDLGFVTENVMQVGFGGGENLERIETLRDELLRNPEIREISLASAGPTSGSTITQYNIEGTSWEDGLMINTFYIDENYLDLFKLELLLGRNFDSRLASDSTTAAIINQTAVEKFGWVNENPIGNRLILPRSEKNDLLLEVIGVVEDFHFEGLQNEVKPVVMRYRPDEFSSMIARLQTDDIKSVTEFMESKWEASLPGNPFGYFFLEDDLANDYELEAVIGKLLKFLTYFTIFIACLGLLGLASYVTLQRTREIGIRKVMGATVKQIVGLLSGDFMKYIVISLLIGLPLAYIGMQQWLNNFAYHTGIGFVEILLTAMITVALAWITVSWQTIKAARTNPVESIRAD